MLPRICCCLCVLSLWSSSAKSADTPADIPTPPTPERDLPPIPACSAGAVFNFLSSDAFAEDSVPDSLSTCPSLTESCPGHLVQPPAPVIAAQPAPIEKPRSVRLRQVPSALTPSRPDRTDSGLTPIQHLRKAAEHLEAAGEFNGMDLGQRTAAQIREAADTLEQQAASRLEELTEQLHATQQEIAKLRRLTGLYDQVRLSCAIVEVTADDAQLLIRAEDRSAKTPNAISSRPLPVFAVSEKENIDSILARLVSRGDAKILARPTIVTRDGRPASLHSGGEFPVLVPQENQSVTVEWREFGVRFEAVPQMLGNGRIRLDVRPEVTQRDYSSAVEIEGMVVPGLTTRRITTQLEMRLGQTLIMGGMTHKSEPAPQTAMPLFLDIPLENRPILLPVSAEVAADEKEDARVLLFLITPDVIDSASGK